LNNLSMRFIVEGKFREAESLLHEALPITRSRFGASSHNAAVVQENLAKALCGQGLDGDETDRLRAEALAILRRPFDPSPEDRINVLLGQAVSEYRRARFSAAEMHVREALEAARQILAEKPSFQAVICRELAGILIAQGNIREATLRLQEGLELNLKSGPRDSIDVASFMSLLALARYGESDVAGHRALLAEMAERFSSSGDPIRVEKLTWTAARFHDSSNNTNKLEGLGRNLLSMKPETETYKMTGAVALLRAGRIEEATRHLEELRKVRKGDFVYVDIYLAIATLKLGRIDEAREARKRAVAWIDKPEKFTRKWDLQLELKLLRRELDELFRGFDAELPANVFAP
jgi:tetratricopeptide (TPR) repeat protein